jgi:hypothetical protein
MYERNSFENEWCDRSMESLFCALRPLKSLTKAERKATKVGRRGRQALILPSADRLLVLLYQDKRTTKRKVQIA